MSFRSAARAAVAGQSCFPRTPVAVVVIAIVILAGLSLSCANSSRPTQTEPSHNAYVTLPAKGTVLLMQINSATGFITIGAQTPPEEDYSPTGLALLPSKKFLYVANSRANTISIFNVAPNGTLTLSGTPTPAGGTGPNVAVIDPSGQYLLVTNTFTNNISVFSIDAGTGALSAIAGSPFDANSSPTGILITPSGKFVYVTNPAIGMVTAFSFSSGVLTPVPGSPFPSLPGGGGGAAALAVDVSERFLYVANPLATNPLVPTIGNISGFNIDPDTGALSTILGSPFTSTFGNGPTALTADPGGKFLYAVTPGSSYSIWCFAITATNGQLTAVSDSPFSVAAGGLFSLIDPVGNFFYIGGSSGIEGYTFDPSTGKPTVITGSPFSAGTAPGQMVFSE
jgi:6-phosphogluconolactonase (cycloisomerase 2 family)